MRHGRNVRKKVLQSDSKEHKNQERQGNGKGGQREALHTSVRREGEDIREGRESHRQVGNEGER